MPSTLQDPHPEVTVRIPTTTATATTTQRPCRITIEPADEEQALFWSLALATLTTKNATTHPVVLVVDDRTARSRRAGVGRPSVHEPMVEPLTPREREVLGHVAEMLSTAEIAATMFVSVNTVRTHVAGILRKLAVSRRADAVRRARAIGLMD